LRVEPASSFYTPAHTELKETRVTDTLEHLEALDQKMQLIQNLLTQAVQATQEAETVIGQIPNAHAPNLVAALPHLQTALHTAVDGHNTLTAQINAARDEIRAHPEQYQPESI
jgi:chromosome segregation ATPase